MYAVRKFCLKARSCTHRVRLASCMIIFYSVPRTFQPCVRAPYKRRTFLLLEKGSYESVERGVGFLLSREKKHCGKERVDK